MKKQKKVKRKKDKRALIEKQRLFVVEKKPNGKRITERQKRYVELRIENPSLSARAAALKAGYSKQIAENPQRYLDPSVNQGVSLYTNRLGLELEKIGATDTVIAAKIFEGFEANKTDITGDKHPDYKTRLDYLKYAGDLKGHKVADKVDVNHNAPRSFGWIEGQEVEPEKKEMESLSKDQ